MLSCRTFGLAVTTGLLAWARPGPASDDAPGATAAHVVSRDGTRIGYAVLGQGSPIVFSHESLESGAEWLAVARHLADRHASYLVDRRGRGTSGPAGQHSLERECEDMFAVLGRAGEDATLLGASYGAIVAIEAALRRPAERLVLYEPPLVLGPDSPIHLSLESSFERYRQLTERGELDEALELGLTMFAAVPANVVAELRKSSPQAWRTMRDLTPTWVPEIVAVRALPMGIERYRTLRTPTLLVTGTESPSFLRNVVAALHEVLPASRVLELPGQGHEAHLTAPGMLADGIASFLSARAAEAQPRIASRR